MMSETITIKYRTRRDYCNCCDQKLPHVETSGYKEFKFSKENIKSWTDWKEIAEYEEDFDNIVYEYVFNTIDFFATSSSDRVIVENSEIEKVKQFLLKEAIC